MRATTRNALVILAVAAAVAGAVLTAVFLLRRKEGFAFSPKYFYSKRGKQYVRASHRLAGSMPCRRNGQCHSKKCTNGRCECAGAGVDPDDTGVCWPGYSMNPCGKCIQTPSRK